MLPTAPYEHLASLLDYPGCDYPTRVRAARAALSGRYERAAAVLDGVARLLPERGERLSVEALDLMQEIFTRTFDVQAITTLGVGYVMFGDDYKRGELLVQLSREQQAAGVQCGCELPDHLPNVLRLMARWEDRDLAAEFATEILYPAVFRMIAEFGPRRVEQRNALYKKHFRTLITVSGDRATIFREPLLAVREVLALDYDLADWQPPEQHNDFLQSVGRELEIEADEGRVAGSGGKR